MTLRHSLFILFLLLTCKDTKFLSEMQVFPTFFHSERYSNVILRQERPEGDMPIIRVLIKQVNDR